METPYFDLDPFGDHNDTTMGASNQSSDQPSSIDNSRPQSRGGNKPKDKKRVGFSTSEDPDILERRRNRKSLTIGVEGDVSPPKQSPLLLLSSVEGQSQGASPRHSRNASGDESPAVNRAHLPQVSPEITQQLRAALGGALPGGSIVSSGAVVPRHPRPALRRGDSNFTVTSETFEDAALDEALSHRNHSARQAHERGKRLERREQIRSAPVSRGASPIRANSPKMPLILANNIPLVNLHHDSDADDSGDEGLGSAPNRRPSHAEAHKLVQAHSSAARYVLHSESSGLRSGFATPAEERGNPFESAEYIPRPERYRGGVLGSLLKLYNTDGAGTPTGSSSLPRTHRRQSSAPDASGAGHTPGTSPYGTGTPTPQHSPPGSGASTPVGGRSSKYWFLSHKHASQSSSSLGRLVSSSTMGASTIGGLSMSEEVSERLRQYQAEQKRPSSKRSYSSGMLSRFSRSRQEENRITVHIAETIAMQRYLLKLCRALMMYGAPTHRLEEYMKYSARVLEIEAQFLYIPNSMLMSFDDPQTHTTEVKLVRVNPGLDFGKLRDTHEVYKDVLHDQMGVEEATQRLDEIMTSPPRFNKWVLIPFYGLASASVGPFAFGARLIDLPIAFLLGCLLGVLQLVIAPQSELYSNVLEVSAAVITSFLARAFGSIHGGRLFCFSALAQSSIALILPGYMVLCASLELQSRSIVAGSVRMVYAIIYSLFLGYGITIGTAMYGIVDRHATSETSCHNPLPEKYQFIAVPIFTFCLIVINQGKWKQAPVMIVIAFVGFIVNFYAAKRFSGNTQVSNTLGALAIGVMANLYTRLGKRFENWCLDQWEDRLRPISKSVTRLFRQRNLRGAKVEALSYEEQTIGDAESTFVRHKRRIGYSLAATAMLPAIFVQVPSGLAVSGSLISGLASADQITGNGTNGTTVVSTTQLELGYQGLNSVVFNVGYSVIQIAIGITVGLFLSALVVYPFGKRRSGLFSF